jgi:hypothetical protein
MTASPLEALRAAAEPTAALYWNDRRLGALTAIDWSGFPHLSARFEAGEVPDDVRAVLEWYAHAVERGEPLTRPPSLTVFLGKWWLSFSGDRRMDVFVPKVDFAAGRIAWVRTG